MRLAIDPGSAGGFAIEYDDGTVKAFKMPDTDTDIIALLGSVSFDNKSGKPVECMMEKVGGFIGTHNVPKAMPCPHCRQTITYYEAQGQPGSAMFVFGDGNGFLRGCCMMAGFRFETVPPRTWQGALGLHKDKGMGKTEWKNLLKDRAQKLFPQIKVTLSTADALLILEFSRRVVPNKIMPKIAKKDDLQQTLPF